MASIDTVAPFLKSYFNNKSITCMEIGAQYGESTQVLLNTLNIEKFIIIDPYEIYDEYNKDEFNKIMEVNGNDFYFNSIKSKFQQYNMEFIREYSNSPKAFNSIADKSLDLCFIDGNHEYEYVYNDIKIYLPKMKAGGIICGDDYFMRHKDINMYPEKGYDRKMVYEAVQDYFKDTDYKIEEYGHHNGHAKTWLVKI